eukprot:NODE_781_length_1873_cov_43.131157_g728_i0.p1 GENE.NODE_781_length_1873_cov_43.131157_g728_i0~~NODE_781_length_1873_cov_43.131157_g728_i0.p1  ORF type:complete len:576 (+),score=153.56 NODE_781_length_1873_cov_43.131157_g728_i0:40-1767(+)
MTGPLILFLSAPPLDASAFHVAACCASPLPTAVEAAGRTFESNLNDVHEEPATDIKPTDGKPKSVQPKKKEESKKKIKSKKLSEAELEQDHYKVLELKSLEWLASEEQIKVAYKRMVVEKHPDKKGGGDDTEFKAVQKAYEVLSDPQKRIAYDSSLPFDDDIPSSSVPPEKFYDAFGPVFHMNARWCSQPAHMVPQLGDASTPYSKVEKFYDFWFHFKSWRDFSSADTHNTEDAECREEKRWMERENERERSKLRKQENTRISTLVDRAYKLDPRVKQKKEEDEMKRQKQRLEEAQQKKKENKAKLLEEKQAQLAKERKEKEEAAAAKAEVKRQKELLKKTKEGIKKALQPALSETYTRLLRTDSIYFATLDWLITKGPQPVLETLLAELQESADLETSIAKFNQTVVDLEAANHFDRYGNPLKKVVKTEKTSDKHKDVWSENELTDLTKAIAKFPGGTFNRWEVISSFIGTKTADQVLRQTKEMTGQLNEGVAPGKPDALKQGDAKSTQIESAGVTLEDVWSKTQQTQLEEAIKRYKDYRNQDKWDQIAAAVTDKSKKQCMDRYKYLASLFKKR